MSNTRILPVTGLLLAIAGVPAGAPAAEPVPLFGGGAPTPTWSVGIVGWQKAGSLTDGRIAISASDARGGMLIGADIDPAAVAASTPRVHLRVGAGNQAARFILSLGDADKTQHKFAFDLSGVPAGAWTDVLAVGAPTVGAPVEAGEPGEIPGLGRITQIAVFGDWSGSAVQVEIDRIDAVGAQREAGKPAATVRQGAQDGAAGQVLTAAAHPKDGPEIIAVQAVDADILAIVIQDRTVVMHPAEPYVAQTGDQIVAPADAPPVPHYRDGKAVDLPPLSVLMRPPTPGAAAVAAGAIGGDGAKRTVQRGEESVGAALERSALADPAAWRVMKGGTAIPITAVAVKLKPDAIASMAALCRVYLTLGEKLQPGATYTVVPHAVNTRQAEMPYVHTSKSARSEAVHASQVGYRPDDPAKRAFLSLWMGTGGAHAYADGLPFEVLDDKSGAVAFSGKATLVRKENEPERVKNGRNLAMTPVMALDFTSLQKPGMYRIHVPGIGCSYPFPIAGDSWLQAMRVSMRGILSQRSGIALAPPLLPYVRPRPMHPDDGFRSVPLAAYGRGNAASIRAAVRAAMAAGPLPKNLPGAWGGYMDAGDWDRHTGHLYATGLLLELYDANPAFWRAQKLDLPAGEVANDIPDLLDEALWNIDFFVRLQDEDGGVHGGIESTEHPLGNEASWQERLVSGVFAPEHSSSYLLAATASQASRQLSGIAPDKSAKLFAAARRAWLWAEAHGDEALERMRKEIPDAGDRIGSPERAWAAAELLHAAPKDPLAKAWLAAYAESSPTERPGSDTLAGEQPLYSYACLPEGLGDPALKERARNAVLRNADQTIALMRGNSFSLGLPVEQLPTSGFVGYCTTPGMVARSLPRAWLLTGKAEYLEATVASCGFGVGANPDNLVFTTGLGANPVRWALHCDSRVLGKPAPPGITVYGPTEPVDNAGMMGWVFQWFTGKQSIPEGQTWPMYESYFDIYVVPNYNEYTIGGTMAPTAYTWGILASRAAKK